MSTENTELYHFSKRSAASGMEWELTEAEQRMVGLLNKVVVKETKSGIDSANDMLSKVMFRLTSYWISAMIGQHFVMDIIENYVRIHLELTQVM